MLRRAILLVMIATVAQTGGVSLAQTTTPEGPRNHAGRTPAALQRQPQLTPDPPTIIDYDPIPGTLAETWKEVAAIVHGKVISAGLPSFGSGLGPKDLVQRVVLVEPIEILKGSDSGPHVLRVVQFGGSKVSPEGREVNTAYTFAPLEPGEEVVLFLVPSYGSRDSFIVAFGPAGVFRITGDRSSVRVPSAAKHMDFVLNRDTVSVRDFKRALRDLRTKSQKVG